MRIKVNGEVRECAEGTTLEALLDLFGIQRQGTAVELNRAIVPGRLLNGTSLSEGDSVEIVRMTGGG